MMEATKRSYNTKTTGQKNHGQGTPDHWVGVTVFVKLHKDIAEQFAVAERANLREGNQGYPSKTIIGLRDKLAAFLKICTKLPCKTAQRHIKTFRTERMYSASQRRLVLKLRDAEMEDLLFDYFEENDRVEEWQGMRPAGWLEQRAQQHLGTLPQFGERQ